MPTLTPPASFALVQKLIPPPFSGRVAVLGAGSIGRRHLTNLANVGIRDLAIYDPTPEVLELAHTAYDVHAVGSLDDIWNWNPDVVFVCAPTSAHLTLARRAVHSGAHLFVEKPLGATLEGWAELAQEAEARGVVTMTACNMRFHPGPQRLRGWLQSGVIGKVLSARFDAGPVLAQSRPGTGRLSLYSAQAEPSGAILDNIHEIDLALWLLGPAQLHTALVLPAPESKPGTDRLAELLLCHETGAVSSLHLESMPRYCGGGVEIIGELGALRWDRKSGTAEWICANGELCEQVKQPESWRVNAMYEAELACFLDACATRRPTFSPLRDGLAMLKIALAAQSYGQNRA